MAVPVKVTYPILDGASGQVLTTDWAGVVSWANESDSLASISCSHSQGLWWNQTAWGCSQDSYSVSAIELEEQVASLQEQPQSQQEELLAIVQSQQEQIAQLQRMVEHQFAMN